MVEGKHTGALRSAISQAAVGIHGQAVVSSTNSHLTDLAAQRAESRSEQEIHGIATVRIQYL